MKILHIARIGDNYCHGVSVVVPRHVCAQQRYEQVGLLNISGYKYESIDCQLDYTEPFDLENLQPPFNCPDLVVFHEVYRPQYLKIYKKLCKKNIPYIIVPHCELTKGAQKKKWIKKKIANLLLFSKFIKNAKAIQCLSEVELNDTAYGKKKFIATNGMDVANEKKEKFSQSDLKFLYIGRIETYQKGLDLLVEAISLIKDFVKRENCKFYIHGPQYPSRCGQINELIEKYSLEDVIKVCGSISGSAKSLEILNSDIFIQTSRFEGMPMGILEAMSYGLPCIVTKGTTLARYVIENDAGWACDTNAEEISETIKLAISEKAKLSNKSDNAYKAVKKDFNWKTVAENTIAQYKSLII